MSWRTCIPLARSSSGVTNIEEACTSCKSSDAPQGRPPSGSVDCGTLDGSKDSDEGVDSSEGGKQKGTSEKHAFSGGVLVDAQVPHESVCEGGSLGVKLLVLGGQCTSIDDGSAEEEVLGSPTNGQACSKNNGKDCIVSKVECEDLLKGVDQEDGQPRGQTEVDDSGVNGSSESGHVHLNGLVDSQILDGTRSGQGAQVVVVVEGAQEPEGEPQREHVNDESQSKRLEADAEEEVQEGVIWCVGHASELDKVKVWRSNCVSG